MTDSLTRLATRVVLGSFQGGTVPDWARRRLADGMGGICIFGENVVSPEGIREVTAVVHDEGQGAIATLDEEGGDVTRLYYRVGSPHAGHAALGVADDLALTAAVATDIGTELAALGVDLDFAPVADVNSNPLNPVIGVRSFGAEPGLVARHTAAWVRGVQSTGVGACLKHFPGHGDTVADSHLALPAVDAPLETLRERELVPFRAGAEAGALAVMTSHVVLRAIDPTRPATFSAAATALLRDPVDDGGLGFDGLLVSDALDMAGASGEIGVPAAAVRALTAGVDLLCLGPHFDDEGVQAVVDAVVEAVRGGELPEARVAEAVARIDEVGRRLQELRAAAAPSAPTSEASERAAAQAVVVTGRLEPVQDAQVIRFVAGGNLAVGYAPWGLPADGAVLGGRAAVDVEEGDRLPQTEPGRPVVALVRGGHRFPWVLAGLEELERRHPDLVVVEMGWPGPERLPGRALVRTHGASAVSARAADRILSQGVR